MTSPLQELTIRCPLPLADVLVSTLFDAGATGVEERPVEPSLDAEPDGGVEREELVELVAYSAEPQQLDAFQAAVQAVVGQLPIPTAVAFARREVSSDWESEWLRHLRPVPLGDALVVQPLGDESPLPRDRRPLVIRPSYAFGDGSHSTTQLAGEAVERHCRAQPGCRVLDVGTGSGVLALAALLSGASAAKLIDVAPEAIAAARDNAELNQLADRCTVSDEPLSAVEGTFDLVACNINESTLLDLASDLARVTAPGGRLVLTGLIAGETAAVESALAACGLAVCHRDELRDWTLLELGRG